MLSNTYDINYSFFFLQSDGKCHERQLILQKIYQHKILELYSLCHFSIWSILDLFVYKNPPLFNFYNYICWWQCPTYKSHTTASFLWFKIVFNRCYRCSVICLLLSQCFNDKKVYYCGFIIILEITNFVDFMQTVEHKF